MTLLSLVRQFRPIAAVMLIACVGVVSHGEAAVTQDKTVPEDSIVTVTDVLHALQSELTTAYGLEGELRLQYGRNWQLPAGIGKDWKLHIQDKPADGPASSMIVRCSIESNGKMIGPWNLSLKAEWMRDAWFAKRPVARGESLKPGDFDLKLTDCLRDREAIPADTDLRELTASRPVTPGRALSWREVTARVLVQRGAQVDVVIQQGSLSISMKAEALEQGARGDRISLRNNQSRKNITAIIIDENLVQISL